MRITALFLLIFSLISCSKPNPNTLVVGTIAGPESDIIETAKQVANDRYHLNIKIVAFNDYNLPNEALEDGSLDANIYQHLPYLKEAMAAHGYHFEAIGRSFVYPMGIYSEKYKHLAEIPDKATIAIPNDPSNELRALLLLQKAKLIRLKPDSHGGINDILSNPKQLAFKEMDAAQLPRILPDVAAAVINTTFALPAGLSPSKDALLTEDKNSPYANVIVIRKDSKKKAQLELLVKAIHSEKVKDKAKQLFGDAAIPAW